MLVVTRDTVLNPAALETRHVPRRFMGRAVLWPRGQGWRLFARAVFEVELLRYLSALLPFVLAALIWQDYALAIAQAPLPMLIVIYLVEAKLLRASPAQREALVSDAEADRGLDLLAARGRALLNRIASRRGLSTGRLYLVVEQSELLRVPCLSYVSVQSEDGPALLRLSREEHEMITEELFAAPLSERQLQRIGLKRKIERHAISFDAAQVSAHARLSALIGK